MDYYTTPKRGKTSRIDIHYYVGTQNISSERMYVLIEEKRERAMIHRHINGEPCNSECEEVDFSEGR